ncbi:MAG: aldo/keto reductase, partial [Oscillospiraceae bacterium]|nr:aldo/keto reductase [Oscillospiraceae bacterium]
ELNEKAEKLGAYEYLLKEKAAGRIKHLGFSFHGPAEELEEILTKHPEMEFVQLQINYIDWDDDEVQSGKCWETARRFGKPIVIMEPVKGGMLAAEDSPVAPILKGYAPDKTVASWAIRFAATREGLITALSGMNSMEQVLDNTDTVTTSGPFSEEELEVLKNATEKFRSIPRIPCTGCRYCVENCPMKIKIPELMEVYNSYLVYNTTLNSDFHFMLATKDAGLPSSCVKCLSCEGHCPQRINIHDIMGKVADLYETK